MCKDGYVYNIEVNKNNNYFANNVLVHNCAHVAASPTQMKMFAKVISKIPARYKYGLTATPTRSDGMIKAMYCYIGTDKDGDFVFGPLCANKYYAIEVWVNNVKHCKICTECKREGKCLKGVKLECKHDYKCDKKYDDKKDEKCENKCDK